jgi:hypothetical protein
MILIVHKDKIDMYNKFKYTINNIDVDDFTTACTGGDPYVTTFHEYEYKIPNKTTSYRLLDIDNGHVIINASVDTLNRDEKDTLRRNIELDPDMSMYKSLGLNLEKSGYFFKEFSIIYMGTMLQFDRYTKLKKISKLSDLASSDLISITIDKNTKTEHNMKFGSYYYDQTHIHLRCTNIGPIIIELRHVHHPQIINSIHVSISKSKLDYKGLKGVLAHHTHPKYFEISNVSKMNNIRKIGSKLYQKNIVESFLPIRKSKLIYT